VEDETHHAKDPIANDQIYMNDRKQS
jgi:hypothetical protein